MRQHQNFVRASFRSMLLLTTAATLCAGFVGEAAAQTTPADEEAAEFGEIIVTARKREETAISVPLAITAVGGEELSRRGVSGLDGLAQLVPTLNIAEGGGTIQGGTVSLRGIAGPDTNPLGDQAVAFNIDNMQIAKSSVRRLGQFDVAQVEVLKGPQTLFFGKNSPGGVITISTADPGDQFEAKVSGGYEFKAREFRTEGYVSGPLSDTLGGRVAWQSSDMKGWARNSAFDYASPSSIVFPTDRRGPENHEFNVRGTLVWKPSDRFSARLKGTYGEGHGANPAYNFQYIFCPYGAPQFPGVVDDCRGDNTANHPGIGPNYKAVDPRFTDETFARQNSRLVSLEMNYDLTDELRLTSVTGYYRFKFETSAQFIPGAPSGPLPFLGFLGTPNLPSFNAYLNREASEEIRLESSFSGPLNFTIGGIYSDTNTRTGANTLANPEAPIEFGTYDFHQKGKAYSAFAQVMYEITPELEIAGGGRYSHEEKRLVSVFEDPTFNTANSTVRVFPAFDKVTFNDFSPEVTLSYRPSSDLTVYGSYKRGFLSGGFNAGTFPAGADISYGPQKVRGFEAGVKAALFDRALRLNVAGFTYKVPGLQVTAFQNTTATISNAGKVTINGGEFDFNYATPLAGLSLSGGAAYLDGQYDEYLGTCYAGQTAALGCNRTNATGNPVQDLGGTRLRNAPKWTLWSGFNYETPVGNGLKFGLSANANYSSSQITDSKSTPGAVSPSRTLIDSTLRIAEQDDRWELALIGTNLTNKHYWATSQEVPLTGNGFVNGNPLADLFAVPSRGRQIMLRATVKFGQ